MSAAICGNPGLRARALHPGYELNDLNAASIETAIKSIKGTARSMGIEVVA